MSANCPTCNTRVYEDLPGGLCPNCLMAAARRSKNEPVETAAMPPEMTAPSLSEMRKLFPEMDVLELVGQGGMGAVYKAVDRSLDRVVALKVFLYRSDDPEFAERFRREAKALAKLQHPNIVTVYQVGQREDLHFMTMEYVDGLNLRQLTSEEKLAPEHAMQLVPKLCEALQYAHDNGVIHRDIKPENILLDSRGDVKVADFGLAKMTGSVGNSTLTRTRQVMGTWNYMAPEQMERPTEVDHRADIYSLGVVIYEMLTGELPLGRFQPPSEKSEIDARLDEIVLRALEKEPARRYQQASDFQSGFESFNSIPANTPVPPIKSSARMGAAATTHNASGPRFHVSIMGGQEKKGNWRVGHPNNLFTLMGGTCLDLTQVDATDVVINSFVIMGGVEIIVPTGANVDIDGFILMGATTDSVHRSNPGSASQMNVRIRSYGLMGGCDVKSKAPKRKASHDVHKPVKQTTGTSAIQNSLLFLYRALAMLVTIAVPILFLAAAFDVLDDDEGKMIGIVTAITAGMFWAGLSYFRILIGARPEDATDDELEEFDNATKVGTLIRSLGLIVGFACPILFIVANFENNDDEIRFAAIICAIVSIGIFALAGHLEETFYGKKSD